MPRTSSAARALLCGSFSFFTSTNSPNYAFFKQVDRTQIAAWEASDVRATHGYSLMRASHCSLRFPVFSFNSCFNSCIFFLLSAMSFVQPDPFMNNERGRGVVVSFSGSQCMWMCVYSTCVCEMGPGDARRLRQCKWRSSIVRGACKRISRGGVVLQGSTIILTLHMILQLFL